MPHMPIKVKCIKTSHMSSPAARAATEDACLTVSLHPTGIFSRRNIVPWGTQGLTRNFTSDAHKVPACVFLATFLL